MLTPIHTEPDINYSILEDIAHYLFRLELLCRAVKEEIGMFLYNFPDYAKSEFDFLVYNQAGGYSRIDA